MKINIIILNTITIIALIATIFVQGLTIKNIGKTEKIIEETRMSTPCERLMVFYYGCIDMAGTIDRIHLCEEQYIDRIRECSDKNN